jgi:endonuclease
MPIYDKPVRLLMRDMAAAFALEPGQTFTRQEAIAWFAEHYPRIKRGTIAAHLVRLSTNAPSRVHYQPKSDEDDVFFQLESGRFRLHDADQDPPPIRADAAPDQQTLPEEESDDIQSPSGSSEFAYEADLRNYIAKNLMAIEPSLMLYEEEGINGIEFPVGGRFIDILAIDGKGDFVVIELKVSRGYDRVVGQLLRYMAWVQAHMADNSQKVRGIIIARNVSQDLLLASSLIPGVQLFEYELSLRVRQMNATPGV